jgi:PTH1 family peptidyl-tRNA hydrolase
MHLVVGLGNPGREYASHRHNVGFLVLDALASVCRADPWREKFSAEHTRARLGDAADEPSVLLKPMTYMNESGRSVQPAAAFFKVPVARVIVVHDELDLPFGTLRVKQGGGHAGHNGLRSLIQRLGSSDFVRLRFGIGRPPPGFRGEVADFVLSSFDAAERAELAGKLDEAVRIVRDVAARGPAAVANVQNERPKAQKAKAPRAPKQATGAPADGSSGEKQAPSPAQGGEPREPEGR